DLEYRRPTVSRQPFRLWISITPSTSMGLGTQAVPQPRGREKRWMMIHQDMLDKGNVENLVADLRSTDSFNLELAEIIRTTANYNTLKPIPSVCATPNS